LLRQIPGLHFAAHQFEQWQVNMRHFAGSKFACVTRAAWQQGVGLYEPCIGGVLCGELLGHTEAVGTDPYSAQSAHAAAADGW
jgi:hypothetical protein